MPFLWEFITNLVFLKLLNLSFIEQYILCPHFPCHLNILVMEVAKSINCSKINQQKNGETWEERGLPRILCQALQFWPCFPCFTIHCLLGNYFWSHSFIALVVKTASTLLNRMATLIEVLNKNHYAKSFGTPVLVLSWTNCLHHDRHLAKQTEIGYDVWNLESFRHQFPWNVTW